MLRVLKFAASPQLTQLAATERLTDVHKHFGSDAGKRNNSNLLEKKKKTTEKL